MPPAFAVAGVVEVPVHGGAGNAEEVGDLLDGALPSVVQLLGQRDLFRIEPRSATAYVPAREPRRVRREC
jgi:hypothetical protein